MNVSVNDNNMSTTEEPSTQAQYVHVLENVTWISNVSGFISKTFPPCVKQLHSCNFVAWHLNLPENHVVMVSFPFFVLKETDYVVIRAASGLELWRDNGRHDYLPVRIFNTSLYLSAGSRAHTGNNVRFIKLLFSYHPLSQVPSQTEDGMFNCSVPFFSSFREHLGCNWVTECHGSEDEDPVTCPNCDETSGKCYKLLYATDKTWYESREFCQQQLGGDLAMMKSQTEWNTFFDLIKNGAHPFEKNIAWWIGLQSYEPSSMLNYYRHIFFWVDRTTAYDVNTTDFFISTVMNKLCFFTSLLLNDKRFLTFYDCTAPFFMMSFACQREIMQKTTFKTPILLSANTITSKFESNKTAHLDLCPNGHWTHEFLTCDPESRCAETRFRSSCFLSTRHAKSVADNILGVSSEAQKLHHDGKHEGGDVTVAMFLCDQGKWTVPFTLLCDFRPDCPDASDETFCVHSHPCPAFTCRNGQCVNYTQVCDVVHDCWDGSDEMCDPVQLVSGATYRQFPPTLIDFTGSTGNYTQSPLETPTAFPPETHFQCSDGNCLPVFVRCNGVYDCRHKEDEQQCDNVTCPGYYRCRSSSVCVHLDHLCDGWPQCPQHDDEWLCHEVCPDNCQCQGLSFVCHGPFNASNSKTLRYLDAAGSGMTPEEVRNNTYLVWLSLKSCGLEDIHVMELPNLRQLDLSNNNLTFVSMHVFLYMGNLRRLSLSRNPLFSLTAGDATGVHGNLLSLDLSFSSLTTFGSNVLQSFPTLTNLNVSSCQIETISDDGFAFTARLAIIDLIGNPVKTFPYNLYGDLQNLESVRSDNYKLCCRAVLPVYLDESACEAPRDEISSCDDLLRSDVYRAVLWLFSLMAMLGNAGSLLFRVMLNKVSFLTGFNIFVSSLGVADMVMGVYLALVGAADHVYRGQYYSSEDVWKSSAMCQAAGFLSLLSCETSAAMVCVITLDRFLVLRFPFSRVRFARRSATVACVLLWGLGILLAALPLLPITSHWRFYSQTGICIPLPVTRRQYGGEHYAFGVMIVLNLLLFVLIASGQLLIYYTVRSTSMAVRDIDSIRSKSQDVRVARRLTSIVVTNFLCWFPIGLLGVLAATGVPIPGAVNVALAILVLPLNSALNPFLYTFNTLLERWERLEERRLLKHLQEKMRATLPDSMTSED